MPHDRRPTSPAFASRSSGSVTEPTTSPGSGKTSGWALASVLCSFGLCPLFTLIAPVLGVRALREIKHSGRPGRGLALTGIVVGVTMTVLWGVVLGWWSVNARGPLIHGPIDELRAGLGGDIAGFKAGFVGDGATADDAEARRFLEELTRRYGMLIEIHQRNDPAAESVWEGTRVRVPYLIDFERQSVDLEGTFAVRVDGRLVLRWEAIEVLDDERGDLIYPATAPTSRSLEEPAEPPVE